MSLYYDRVGNPVDMMTWAKTIENPVDKIVRQEHVDGWFVSTVFLGLDHRFGDGPPLIFETMIFPPGWPDDVPTWFEEYQERYSTEAEAVAGHDRAVAWLRGKLAGAS